VIAGQWRRERVELPGVRLGVAAVALALMGLLAVGTVAHDSPEGMLGTPGRRRQLLERRRSSRLGHSERVHLGPVGLAGVHPPRTVLGLSGSSALDVRVGVLGDRAAHPQRSGALAAGVRPRARFGWDAEGVPRRSLGAAAEALDGPGLGVEPAGPDDPGTGMVRTGRDGAAPALLRHDEPPDGAIQPCPERGPPPVLEHSSANSPGLRPVQPQFHATRSTRFAELKSS